jgi:hypothetical protein
VAPGASASDTLRAFINRQVGSSFSLQVIVMENLFQLHWILLVSITSAGAILLLMLLVLVPHLHLLRWMLNNFSLNTLIYDQVSFIIIFNIFQNFHFSLA